MVSYIDSKVSVGGPFTAGGRVYSVEAHSSDYGIVGSPCDYILQ